MRPIGQEMESGPSIVSAGSSVGSGLQIHIKHLSKSNSITKLKALEVLKSRIWLLNE